jgi:molybdopterin-guanine dinucleotide biosynthesis protein A
VAAYSVAIVAGGQASRFGGIAKSRLVVDGRAIVDRQLDVLRGLGVEILIVANEPDPFAHTGLPIVPDRIPGAGALGGVYTALVCAGHDTVIVLACDMPFVTAPLILHLAERSREADVVVPRDARGRHPLCAAYATRVAPHVRQRIDAGDLRVGSALDGLVVHEVGPDMLAALDSTGRLLVNVNTPEDYDAACAHAGPAR